MFRNLQLEIMDRFTAVEQHFRKYPKHPPEIAQTAKGLVFVQVYAVYEYTARAVTRLAITRIVSLGHSYSELRPSLLSLFLDPDLRSLRDSGPNKIWEARIKLLEQCISENTITPVDIVPTDGTHYRHTHIQLILRTLGVRRTLTIRRRHLYQIDQLVENRNRIAHGDETAVDIGRRYSREDILRHIRLMQRICLRLIFIVSEHCDMPDRHCR